MGSSNLVLFSNISMRSSFRCQRYTCHVPRPNDTIGIVIIMYSKTPLSSDSRVDTFRLGILIKTLRASLEKRFMPMQLTCCPQRTAVFRFSYETGRCREPQLLHTSSIIKSGSLELCDRRARMNDLSVAKADLFSALGEKTQE